VGLGDPGARRRLRPVPGAEPVGVEELVDPGRELLHPAASRSRTERANTLASRHLGDVGRGGRAVCLDLVQDGEAVAAAVTATIPVAWAAGLLTVPWLITVTFVVGACSLVFRAFNFPHLVSVVHESQRAQALVGFQPAYSLAAVGGPGLSGLLVQVVTAPLLHRAVRLSTESRSVHHAPVADLILAGVIPRLSLAIALLPALLAAAGPATAEPAVTDRPRAAATPASVSPSAPAAPSRWTWPFPGHPRILRVFAPPPQPWLPGHRGVDLAASPGTPVRAAGPGTVAYAGPLAGRGVVTVLHAGGLRTTYLPVRASVRRGQALEPGEAIGTVEDVPGHCPTGCLHWGLLRDRHYLDPLLLLGHGQVRLLPLRTGGAP
jgi:murein DD-endopeptidase MepM/ murein hydrolase activator NlpD